MRTLILASLTLLLFACAEADTPEDGCAAITDHGQPYVVCAFPADSDIRLFHTHPDGQIFGYFDRLAEHVGAGGKTLAFAMNAGMYHDDRRPVGLYIEHGSETAPIVTREGPGNFGMLPNGVFWIDTAGTAHITESRAYAALAPDAVYASQSGPMLVINGDYHPALNPDGTSRKRRNGVGISADGSTVYFAISDAPVNFHSFARLFRDRLDTPNALFFDGVVSKIYAPELGRNERSLDMGPMVAVVAPAESD